MLERKIIFLKGVPCLLESSDFEKKERVRTKELGFFLLTFFTGPIEKFSEFLLALPLFFLLADIEPQDRLNVLDQFFSGLNPSIPKACRARIMTRSGIL